MGVIKIYNEDTPLRLRGKRVWVNWVKALFDVHGRDFGSVNYILCSDDYLHKVNVDYLQHDTLTDVITFDYTEDNLVQGDIFVSIDRVKENAQNFGVSWEKELARVFAHGALHLMGFDDHKKNDIIEMRKQEDAALALYDKLINLT